MSCGHECTPGSGETTVNAEIVARISQEFCDLRLLEYASVAALGCRLSAFGEACRRRVDPRRARPRLSRMRTLCRLVAIATICLAGLAPLPAAARGQAGRPVLAAFAHPDDERVIGPLLSRLGREGREVHLVI